MSSIKVKVGSSVAKDGRDYTFMFVSPSDMPEEWLAQRVKGTGKRAVLPEGMELVWSLTHDAFRVFNHRAATDLSSFDAEPDTVDFIGQTHRDHIAREPNLLAIYRPDLYEAQLAAGV